MTARPTEATILILSLVCVLVSIIGCQTKEAPTRQQLTTQRRQPRSRLSLRLAPTALPSLLSGK